MIQQELRLLLNKTPILRKADDDINNRFLGITMKSAHVCVGIEFF